jgi:hypothetical protein
MWLIAGRTEKINQPLNAHQKEVVRENFVPKPRSASLSLG